MVVLVQPWALRVPFLVSCPLVPSDLCLADFYLPANLPAFLFSRKVAENGVSLRRASRGLLLKPTLVGAFHTIAHR